MSPQDYPFVQFQDAKGFVFIEPAPYLPIRITNPHTGEFFVTYALIDTGAEACVFPAELAVSLGHDFRGKGVYFGEVIGISGPGTVYMHTFNLEILLPNRQDVLKTFDRALIKCRDHKHLPAVLGVSDCLRHFRITIDYLKQVTTISC